MVRKTDREVHRIELVGELDAHDAEALRLELRRLLERHAPRLRPVRIETRAVRPPGHSA